MTAHMSRNFNMSSLSTIGCSRFSQTRVNDKQDTNLSIYHRRNHGKTYGATSVMVGQSLAPWLEWG